MKNEELYTFTWKAWPIRSNTCRIYELFMRQNENTQSQNIIRDESTVKSWASNLFIFSYEFIFVWNATIFKCRRLEFSLKQIEVKRTFIGNYEYAKIWFSSISNKWFSAKRIFLLYQFQDFKSRTFIFLCMSIYWFVSIYIIIQCWKSWPNNKFYSCPTDL